jgi:ATP-dependent RNA helicase HelY
VLVLTEDRRVRRVAVRDLGGAPVRVGKVAMPRQLSPKSPRFKSYVARALADMDPPQVQRPRRRRSAASDPELIALRAELRAHPVHGCPDLGEHEKWMLRHDQLAKEQRTLEERVRRRTGSLVRTFDRVLEVLGSLGYVDGFALTPKGETLRRVYAETDLVVVEAMHRGVWRGLDPAELAACVSSLVYETRGADGPPGDPPVPPTRAVEAALAALGELQEEVHAHEQASGLTLTRQLDPGFADPAYRWTRGDALEDVLATEDITPGDFVRVTKQLIDLLRQVALVAEDPERPTPHRHPSDACQRRGVAYSGVLWAAGSVGPGARGPGAAAWGGGSGVLGPHALAWHEGRPRPGRHEPEPAPRGRPWSPPRHRPHPPDFASSFLGHAACRSDDRSSDLEQAGFNTSGSG